MGRSKEMCWRDDCGTVVDPRRRTWPHVASPRRLGYLSMRVATKGTDDRERQPSRNRNLAARPPWRASIDTRRAWKIAFVGKTKLPRGSGEHRHHGIRTRRLPNAIVSTAVGGALRHLADPARDCAGCTDRRKKMGVRENGAAPKSYR